LAEEPELPEWVKKRLKLGQRALRELSQKRGPKLKVFKGLDMKGI
jgi:hypothetical protein